MPPLPRHFFPCDDRSLPMQKVISSQVFHQSESQEVQVVSTMEKS